MSNIIGYTAYTNYVAVKTHFTNEKYNYFKHKGAKITEGSLKKHNDRYWFVRLQEKFADDELVEFFLAQYTANHLHDYWVGDSFGDKCIELYTTRKKRMGQFTRFIFSEIEKLYQTNNKEHLYKVASGYPLIINAYLGGRISLEAMIVLDELNGWIEQSDALVGIVGAPLAMKLKKYKPFLNYDIKPLRKKYRELVEE